MPVPSNIAKSVIYQVPNFDGGLVLFVDNDDSTLKVKDYLGNVFLFSEVFSGGTNYTAGNLMSLAGDAISFVGGTNSQNITVDVATGAEWAFRSNGTDVPTLTLRGQSNGSWAKLTFDSHPSSSNFIDTNHDGLYFQSQGNTIFSYAATGITINSIADALLGTDSNGLVLPIIVSNGLTYTSGSELDLGGTLFVPTTIDMNGNTFTFIGNGTGLFTLQNTTVNGSIGQTFTGGASPVNNYAFINATSVSEFQFQFSGISVGSYNATSWTFAQRATFNNGFNVANAINNGIGTASSDSRLMILGNTAGAGSSEKILRLANSTGDLTLALGNGRYTFTQYTNYANSAASESYTALTNTATITLGASASGKTYTGISSVVSVSGGVSGTALTANFFTGGIIGGNSPQFAVFSTYTGASGFGDGQMYLGNSGGTRRITFAINTSTSEGTIGNTNLNRVIFNQTEVRFDLGGNAIGSITSANSVNGFLALQNGATPTSRATQRGSYNIAWRGTAWNGSAAVASWFNARVVADTTVDSGRWLRMYGGVGSNLTETGTSAFSIYFGGSGGERYFGILKDSPAATLHIGASATNVPQIILDTTSVTGTPTNGSIWFDGTNFKGVTGGTVKTFTLA